MTWHKGGTHRTLGYVAASSSLIFVFAASGVPVPLYERYRVGANLTSSDLLLTAVAYFAAVIATLLFLGRLSGPLGRRWVGVAANLLAVAGCLALFDVHSLTPLIVGRLLHGCACGLAASALAAYIVDTAPRRPAWLAAATNAGGSPLGMTVGALGSGVLAEYGPFPMRSGYVAVVVALLLCVGLLLISPETVTARSGIWSSLRPTLRVPPSVRGFMPAAAAVFVTTMALGGFYKSLAPTLAAQALGNPSAVLAAVFFASFMAPNAVGGPLTGRLSPRAAQRLGIVAFAAAITGVALGLRFGSVAAVLIASLVAGAAQGAAFTGSLRSLLPQTVLEDRAGLMTTVYTTAYTGAALVAVLAGLGSTHLDLVGVGFGYAAITLAGAASALVLSRGGADPNRP